MTAEQQKAARREAQVATLEAQLDRWTKKMDAVLARAARRGAPRAEGDRVRVEGLRARHAAMHARLIRFETAGTQSWGTFKSEIESDWQDLELAFEDLA